MLRADFSLHSRIKIADFRPVESSDNQLSWLIDVAYADKA
jgi:hypothetical protein